MHALRFLMDHLHESMTAADVAREVSLCPSQLNRIFMKHLGRSIKEEQIRLRMQKVRELLGAAQDENR